ncbi:hypothetical protein FB451DRAFT_370750 [Mycena latifolia]|nr:hypothetical protein FB451DRAFT_272911 [Mycena latifolia]KAJ7469253.1 hypothetical protein FB451DRAFT_370750 [Mycena latifolia]
MSASYPASQNGCSRAQVSSCGMPSPGALRSKSGASRACPSACTRSVRCGRIKTGLPRTTATSSCMVTRAKVRPRFLLLSPTSRTVACFLCRPSTARGCASRSRSSQFLEVRRLGTTCSCVLRTCPRPRAPWIARCALASSRPARSALLFPSLRLPCLSALPLPSISPFALTARPSRPSLRLCPRCLAPVHFGFSPSPPPLP